MTVFGMIEAGGTKFNCAVGSSYEKYLEEIRVETTTPDKTLRSVISFFREMVEKYGNLRSLGIASFGPLDLDKKSSSYGYITRTPKPNWSHTDILGILKNELSIPCDIDTDVNCAILSEAKWGAARGTKSSIYVTIGTGIGAGIIVDGKLLHGKSHPEVGHMMIQVAPQDKDFRRRICSFHPDCLTSLASGPAIRARWGVSSKSLPKGHDAWDLEANYLALMCINLTLTLSPEKIILDGGVMGQPFMIELIREKFQENLGGYLVQFDHKKEVDDYIVSPVLKNSGLSGAFLMAERAIGINQ